jgi:ATP-dependent DNA helicase DinG
LPLIEALNQYTNARACGRFFMGAARRSAELVRREWAGVQRSLMRQEAQEALETMLAADGPIARALGASYEPRPEQAIMARRVMEAMTSRGTLLAEAGTGVGKSFAYLVPAMVRCMLLGEKVVVSTHTIALQEQLVERDIPTLAGVIGPLLAEKFGDRHGGRELFALKPVLVKGRGNYLSIRRLKLAADRAEVLLADADARSQLERIVEWAYSTHDGTLSSLPQLDRPEVWTHVQSDTDNCMGRKCPHYQDCFYQRARAEAETANLLVCNHALFFSDMQLRFMSWERRRRGCGIEFRRRRCGDGECGRVRHSARAPARHSR